MFTTLIEERLPERADASAGCCATSSRRARPAPRRRRRGAGARLLVGIDLVPPVGDVLGACRDRGLLVLTAGDNTLRLAPRSCSDEDAARGVAIIDEALAAVE